MSEISFSEPFALFAAWMKEAEASEVNDPEAVCVSSVDAAGRPSSRMVLLKAVDERGFVFYTNFESRKGTEILANPQVALLFHWKSLRRQVRIEGRAVPVDPAEADAYFATRARGSQIGAWASQQSRPLESRFALERRVAEFAAKFGLGKVPRPDHWSGFRVPPDRLEFWRDKPFRLHDRDIYIREGEGWARQKLYP